MEPLTIGVDLGQRRDPTATAVVEREQRPGPLGFDETHHLVRYLERLPLGTPYPEVAKRVADVVRNAQARLYQLESDRLLARWGRLAPDDVRILDPVLFVDATGVGTAVTDMLKATDLGRARLYGVYFTYGDKRTEVGDEIRLGKAWLVSRLQGLLQSGRLHLPQTQEARSTGEELLDYEIRVDENANDRYGAFKTGKHDDLVTALGLATQIDESPKLVIIDDPVILEALMSNKGWTF